MNYRHSQEGGRVSFPFCIQSSICPPQRYQAELFLLTFHNYHYFRPTKSAKHQGHYPNVLDVKPQNWEETPKSPGSCNSLQEPQTYHPRQSLDYFYRSPKKQSQQLLLLAYILETVFVGSLFSVGIAKLVGCNLERENENNRAEAPEPAKPNSTFQLLELM